MFQMWSWMVARDRAAVGGVSGRQKGELGEASEDGCDIVRGSTK